MLKRAIVLFSGGIDSTVALWWARSRYDVTALSFNGAGRPKGEIRACRTLARRAGVPHLRVDLPFLRTRPDGYVPGRNLAFHAAGLSIAEQQGAKTVIAGHNRSDASHYPDAREPFFRKLAAMSDGIRILRPFRFLSDGEVAKLGIRLGAPLDLTWSCYRNGTSPCGRCAACVDRRAALR